MIKQPLKEYIENLVDKRCKVSTVSLKFRLLISYDQKFDLLKDEVKVNMSNQSTYLFIRYMNNLEWNW